jgi:hypothetical protein
MDCNTNRFVVSYFEFVRGAIWDGLLRVRI